MCTINEYKKYKYVLIDLWGTIFIENNNKIKQINYDRAKILSKYSNNKDIQFWYDKLLDNIKQFKIKEKYGTSIKPIERIESIINNSQDKILQEFDNLYYQKYIPNINYKLINEFDSFQKLILISNTGLTTKNCIIKILKKYDIYNKFEKLYFSQDYDVCKPNIEFFKKPINGLNIPQKEIVMIGDSIEMDYIPCKKIGIDCIIKDWSK